ncbi:hypothetical protein IFM89_023425 [Coptis chinensis]|uniref:Uncharacterized protein n=1 Tax=Coptis chinensis TaxID=261450 RepID=A0A835H288_9MAGN|nr:hypothetical protein IFM89_023425 [Coptis chinensis]
MDLYALENPSSVTGETSLSMVQENPVIVKDGTGAPKASFADKVRGAQPQQINLADLPVPEMKGNIPSIRLSQKAVERGMLYCKFCLIGRLEFQKIKLEEVKTIAQEKWHPQGDWKIVPLGKGFFMIRLTYEQLPENNNGKEAAETDQPAWKRKKNKRNRKKKNPTTQAPNAGVSGTKDALGYLIEAYATESGEIFQDSISELEEIPQNTLLRGDQAIVSERADDQVGGKFQEGENSVCGIRPFEDAHSLQLVVAAVTDPIASLKSTTNTLRALNEADSLLAASCWADMAEEAEEAERAENEGTWRTQKKKATKPKWMEQDLPPPSTRARLASIPQ